ncbi:hypothetical protein C3K47_08755 [Solitalea longa]|uniref:Uncharacterized protein n=1 Tax=Solitalea longa TaxID=2079460 RepID=A0A2S5A4B4_9SPHI|nr:hypothetical protein [Solitalea longa]POY37137.1 hypothetical protein C3K47_08755 [Solitalea longa]
MKSDNNQEIVNFVEYLLVYSPWDALNGLQTEFIMPPEAMEYRETVAILARMDTKEVTTVEQIIAEEFPISLT